MGLAAYVAMTPVFVDASFWIALRDRKDPMHSEAVRIGQAVAQSRRRLVTTVLVFAEIHAYFSRFLKLREQVTRDFWSGGIGQIEHPDHADYEAAFSLLQAAKDKSYSFCDAVSFAVMRRLELQDALSFDGHFHQIGEFTIL